MGHRNQPRLNIPPLRRTKVDPGRLAIDPDLIARSFGAIGDWGGYADELFQEVLLLREARCQVRGSVSVVSSANPTTCVFDAEPDFDHLRWFNFGDSPSNIVVSLDCNIHIIMNIVWPSAADYTRTRARYLINGVDTVPSSGYDQSAAAVSHSPRASFSSVDIPVERGDVLTFQVVQINGAAAARTASYVILVEATTLDQPT